MTSSLLAALLVLAAPKVELKVNVKNGDILSGTSTFRVVVTSDDPLNQVEFYVGDDLRDTDSSTPYEFKIDTLEENEGPVKLTFAAYTNKGDSAKASFTVKIDNGVSKGADFHVEQAREFVINQRWDDAIHSGRIALKADPQNQGARFVMARAYMGKGVMDRAQKYAEDFVATDPNSPEGKELLMGVNMLRALRTIDREGDPNQTQVAISQALKAAISARQEMLTQQFEKIGEPNAQNLKAYADAAVRCGRYTLAVNALAPVVRNADINNPINNRYAYALIKGGRYDEALNALNRIEKFGAIDAWGLGAKAMMLAVLGDRNAATEYLKRALLMDPQDLGVRTSQAFIALRDNNTRVLTQIASGLNQDAGMRPEIAYYSFALSNAMADYAVSRKYFERAVLAEPLTEEVYVEEANRSLNLAINSKASIGERQFQGRSARNMYEAALTVRPESYRALVGICMVYASLGDREAIKFAEAAYRAAPKRPLTPYVFSAVMNADGKPTEAEQWRRKAAEIDATYFQGRPVPDLNRAWAYMVYLDRIPVITPPK